MAGSALTDPDTHTVDRWLGGRLVVRQPTRGYRVAIDPIVLAAFAGTGARTAVDLGAGVGGVTLTLLARDPDVHVVAVEAVEAYVRCLRENLDANGFTARATVLEGDVLSIARSRRGSARLVVANPPYFAAARATVAHSELTRAARTGRVDDPLAEFVAAARLLLARAGRACFVWPADDVERLFSCALSKGLHPKRLRWVHPRGDRPATRVLAEFKAGRAGGSTVEPPLVLANPDGTATDEMRALAGPGALDGG